MSEPRVVALITARGGSKGLPRKCVLPLAGRPLIEWSIDAGRGAAQVAETVVTTEDPEIAAVALAAGATLLERPAELATDHARSEDVVAHALRALRARGAAFTHFVLLQPTSPLRDAGDVDAAIAGALCRGVDCALSVTRPEHHPYKMLVERQGEVVPVLDTRSLSTPRQELPPAYRQNGAIYFMRCETFERARTFFVPPVYVHEMPVERSVDIDVAADLARCEAWLGAQRA